MRDLADAEPDSIYQMIGQTQVKNQVITAIDAAQQDGGRFESPVLMVGPGGCGKSQTAKCISNMISTECRIVLAQTLRTTGDVAACFLEQRAGSVLFLDEASGLSDGVQLAMYLAIDSKKVYVPGRNRSPVALDLEPFTLLLATTHEFTLNDSLRQRCRMILRFQHYTKEDLRMIAKQRASAVGWQVVDEVFDEAAKRGRGTPRLVLRLLNASHRTARSEGAPTVTLDHFRKTCLLEAVDCKGLDVNEQRYLQILLEGPQRVNVIASKMSLPRKTIQDVIEGDYLLRSSLVAKEEDSRRVLTPDGLQHARLLASGQGYE
jgi:Holliday junction DNA helicase RuvB